MSCNPAAIADHLLAHTDLPLVWALRESVPFDDRRVRSVRYRSSAYYRALATTRYLVNNVTFPPLFDKRDDQVYLNTWHGTPLKRMGRDAGAPFSQIANTVANFEAADVLLTGFQTYQKSPRAPDLLLKLGIALAGAGETDTACRTFFEVAKRYPKQPAAFNERLQAERQKTNCPA